MPPDGTTATDPGVTTLPATPAAPPPAVPAPQPQVFGQAEPPPFASSRQLRQAGETEPGDTSPEYWRAKYDGVIGAAQERWRKMTGQIEAGQMEVRARDDQIARITTDLEAVRAQAATLVTTQQALEAANAQIAQLQGQVARQAVLMKHPKLLSATVKAEDGTESNPILDLIMNSKMTAEELETKAVALAATLQQVSPSVVLPGTVPPPPEQSVGEGPPGFYHRRARPRTRPGL